MLSNLLTTARSHGPLIGTRINRPSAAVTGISVNLHIVGYTLVAEWAPAEEALMRKMFTAIAPAACVALVALFIVLTAGCGGGGYGGGGGGGGIMYHPTPMPTHTHS